MLTDERRAEFEEAVASHRLKIDGARSDRAVRLLGIALMVAGVVGSFVAYNASLSYDDLRDVSSSQTLALGFLAVTVVGTGLFVAATVARVLRLWLLRQVAESEARSAELIAALRGRS